MKHTGKWELDIGIPLNGFESMEGVFKLCEEIETLVGKKDWSAGCGCGYRDIQIPFDTEEVADEAEKKVIDFLDERKIKIGMGDDYAYISVSTSSDEKCECEDCAEFRKL